MKLAEDRGGAVYIKGLKEVPVTSADEAYQLLMIGRQNLQVYLNNISKLLFQLYVEVLMPLFFFSVRSDAAEPTLFAFPLYLYDKGGAGRSRGGSLLGPNFHAVILRSGRLREDQKDPQHGRPPEGGWKHQHILTRLGESHQGTPAKSGHQRPQEASTNTLQVTISSSVQNNLPRKIFFLCRNKLCINPLLLMCCRDSKLTRLFQSFFTGRGKASMCVNISQSPYLFDESLQVLKFSAIASKVSCAHAPTCYFTKV